MRDCNINIINGLNLLGNQQDSSLRIDANSANYIEL